MMKTAAYIVAGLVGLGMICWTTVVSYQASVEQTRLAMEAKKYKAEQGNKIKLGLTREKPKSEIEPPKEK